VGTRTNAIIQAVVPCQRCAKAKIPCVWTKLGADRCEKCGDLRQKCLGYQMGPEQAAEGQATGAKAAVPKVTGEHISV
jgi:hypothetical protein